MMDIKPMENYFAALPSEKLARMLHKCRMATTKEERITIYNTAMNYIVTMNDEQKKQKWIKIFKKVIDKNPNL